MNSRDSDSAALSIFLFLAAIAIKMIFKFSSQELHIPSELLEQIFNFLERDLRSYDYKSQWHLYPLLFVCKEWRDIAQRRLYFSVGIEGTRSIGGDGSEKCGAFYETVKANPFLASLVRELRIGAFYQSGDESSRHTHILRLCHNVTRVELAGSDRRLLGELKAALAQADLAELSISHLGRGDREGTELCTPSKVFTYILNWPRLRKFSAQTSSVCELDGREAGTPISPFAVKGRCSGLREISLKDCSLNAKHLLLLPELAPNIERASISVQLDATEALQTCLQRWSSTLTHLSLSSNETTDSIMAGVYPNLQALRSLEVPSHIMPPDAVVEFAHLETLEYAATTEHIELLSETLRRNMSLPSSKKLILRSTTDFWSKSAELPRIREAVLALRKICGERVIHLSDFVHLFGG